MRLLFLALAVTALAACHGHDHDGYDTFQACYDEHHGAEALPVKEAIVVCCLDHPVGGVSPVCGDTAAQCETYLGGNLSTTSATTTEVTEACAEYIVQKGM